jgi:hypothetical protein
MLRCERRRAWRCESIAVSAGCAAIAFASPFRHEPEL